MFAPPIAKPKAKTAVPSKDTSAFQRATPFGQRHGDVEQAQMFQPLLQGGASLNAHGNLGQDGPASMSAQGGPRARIDAALLLRRVRLVSWHGKTSSDD